MEESTCILGIVSSESTCRSRGLQLHASVSKSAYPQAFSRSLLWFVQEEDRFPLVTVA